MTDRKRSIQDNISGSVVLSPFERDLIRTPTLVRLTRIQQLGLGSLVFPGATHTRFSHSIGVMRVADRLAATLHEQGSLTEIEREKLRVAGLLHDVGQYPLSHCIESVYRMLGDPEVGDLLETTGPIVERQRTATLLQLEIPVAAVAEVSGQALEAAVRSEISRDRMFSAGRLGLAAVDALDRRLRFLPLRRPTLGHLRILPCRARRPLASAGDSLALIAPWERVLEEKGVTVACMTSRTLNRVAEVVAAERALSGSAPARGRGPFPVRDLCGDGCGQGPTWPKQSGLERLNWLGVTGYPWVLSQRNRDYESEGQRFESSWARHKTA